MSVNEKMTAIADAIRSKTGGTEALTLDDMASGVNDVYDAGVAKLWRIITFNGKRTHANRVFAESDWGSIEELPLVWAPTGYFTQLFYNYKGAKLPRTQYLDLSKPSSANIYNQEAFSQMFAWWSDNYGPNGVIPDYGLPAVGIYYQTFANSRGLKTITKIRTMASTVFNNTFMSSPNIVNITFEGVIGKNIDVSPCTKLSHDSLMNIIECLKDYSEDTSGTVYTLTMGSTNMAKLTDEELLIIKNKGWDYK